MGRTPTLPLYVKTGGCPGVLPWSQGRGKVVSICDKWWAIFCKAFLLDNSTGRLLLDGIAGSFEPPRTRTQVLLQGSGSDGMV